VTKAGLYLHGFDLQQFAMWPHKYNEKLVPYMILKDELVKYPEKKKKAG